MPILNIAQLKAIQAVYEHDGHLSNAATDLSITPSALSHRIKEAEHLMNSPIFIRQNKKLILNKAGKRLYSTVQSILKNLESAEYDFKRISQGITRVIRISSNSYNSYYWLTALMGLFNKQFPNTEIEVIAEAASGPLLALKDGIIDIALLTTNQKHSEFRVHELFTDEMVAVTSRHHPLASRHFIDPEDLHDVTFITNKASPEEGREHEFFLKNNHIRMKRIITVGFTDLIIDMVSANLGVSILTRWVAAPYLATNDLVLIPLTKNPIHVNWQFFTRADKPLSQEEQMIIEWLRKNKDKCFHKNSIASN